MNGLDRIIDQIAEDAKAASEEKLDAARAAARRTTERAEEKARADEAQAKQQAQLEYRRIISRAQSTGEIAKKSVLLREKQRIIDEIMHDAHVKLVGLDDAQYFDFMEKLLDKYASGEWGKLILSPRDRARATDSFLAAAQRKGLSLSAETREMDGGFILSYGNIEENCSIEALMDSQRDHLHDVVRAFLFGQG